MQARCHRACRTPWMKGCGRCCSFRTLARGRTILRTPTASQSARVANLFSRPDVSGRETKDSNEPLQDGARVMTSEPWQRVKVLFETARTATQPEREHLLSEAEDAETAAHVRQLLEAYDQSSDFLEEPAI